jgi:hypothetical protein
VKGVVGREVDHGDARLWERRGPGYPVVFYEVAVHETLRGETGESVVVGRFDPEQGVRSSIPTSVLQPGQQIMLFLVEQTSEDAPGISLFDHFYAVVSSDNGMFDVVSDDRVRPRRPELFASMAGSREPMTFGLGEIRKKVRGVEPVTGIVSWAES